MSRTKKPTEEKRPPTLDKRIKNLVSESWIASLYFSIAIDELKQKFEQMTDEELTIYLQRLIAPDAARSHIEYIYKALHNISDDDKTGI